jgi:PAS domain S-box-containing protein
VKVTDTGKTKQQLIDELNSLRCELSERERMASGAVNSVLQFELDKTSRNHELLDSILDVAADAILSIDENQRITRFNQSAEQTFGYRAQEIMGESVEILVPEQFRRNHSKYVEDFAGKPSPSRSMNERADIVGQKKDGTTFPARASISRIEQDGKITLTVFLRDISEIRLADQEVRRTRDELAHVNRIGMLGEISASLAHELNQPLAAILTNAQVLKREIEANPMSLEGADETITDVIQDTRRAAEVINRLRALLKPKERLVEVVDLNQIVAGATDLLNSEIVIRQASLTLELAPDLPAVFGDHVHLQQVVLNLIGNALDAMDAIDPADRHLLIRTSQAGSTVAEVCVEDSGVGFEGEPSEQIFEPFYTTKERGMGMGLAISRTMLRTHGGRLWAENNRGPGTTFYFTLPVADGADAIATARQADEPNEDRSDVATVFIVDDDPSVRQAMGRLIGSAGYAVEAFASAQAFLQRERYDGIGCLVVDLYMPGETGLDLQTTLNTRDYTMPIVFITGGGNTTAGVRAMKQGAVDFLSKPVDDEELLSVIARAVEVDEQARTRFKRHAGAVEKIARLTARETEVMSLVVKGMLNKQIASALGISEKTVKVHRGHVMQKVEARSVTDLVRLAEITADDS